MDIFYTVGNDIKLVTFDATVRELHRSSATVTTHPIEVGANPADHIRVEPDGLSVEVFVTNTPITSLGVDGADGAVSPLTLTDTANMLETGAQVKNGSLTEAQWVALAVDHQANVLQFPQGFNRVLAVYTALRRLMGVIFSVTTSLRGYDYMAIVDMGTPRDSEHSNAVSITLELTHVDVVESQLVAAPDPVQTRGKGQKNKGAKATETPDKDKTSLARKLIDRYSGINLGNSGVVH